MAKAKKAVVKTIPEAAPNPVTPDNTAIDAIIAKLSEYLGGGANPEQVQCIIDDLNFLKSLVV